MLRLRKHSLVALSMLTLCGSQVPVTGTEAAEIEIAYDDGSAEQGDEVGAVRFTPAQYAVMLKSIRFYDWGLDAAFHKIWMYDDDGPEGSPGTLLFGPISFPGMPSFYHWVEFDVPDSLQAVIEDGDFYVAIKPGYDRLLTPPLGRDVDGDPQNRSWTLGGDTWSQLAPELGNLMIRVVVEQEPVPVQSTTWGRIKALYR